MSGHLDDPILTYSLHLVILAKRRNTFSSQISSPSLGDKILINLIAFLGTGYRGRSRAILLSVKELVPLDGGVCQVVDCDGDRGEDEYLENGAKDAHEYSGSVVVVESPTADVPKGLQH